MTPEAGRFRHHAGNPLPIDALVVDEASMLDLALATKLFEAVPAHARIVLLGDKDQLAAVEAGAVFAELSADPSLTQPCREAIAGLCGLAPEALAPPAPAAPSALRDSVVWLTESFRFAGGFRHRPAGGGHQGRRGGTGDGLAARKHATRPRPGSTTAARRPRRTRCGTSSDAYAGYLETVRNSRHDPAAVTEAFGRFRVLCALREGPRGVEAINESVRPPFPPRPGPCPRSRRTVALVSGPAGDRVAQRLSAETVQRRHRHRPARRGGQPDGLFPRHGRRLPRRGAGAPAAPRNGFRHDGAQIPGLGIRRRAADAARRTQPGADAGNCSTPG